MNRILLLLLVLVSSQSIAQQTDNLLRDVPASENSILQKRAQKVQLANKEIQSRLLGKYATNAKNDDDAVQAVVHIQAGKTRTVCLDTLDLAGNFVAVTDMSCSTLTVGTASITDNCFTYSALTGVTGRDTLCLELCDDLANCMTYIYPITVSPPIPLPFYDDFSASEVVPNPQLWQDADVFVNKTIGITPPSLGQVTFDGIDANGNPYGGGHGPSDKLTSTFIDLNAFSPADNVYFSYWVQPKGYGDRPESKDSLVLDFKDENGQWNRIETFMGIPVDTPSLKEFSYERQSIALSDEKYFHDGFQFRFTNHSTNTGAVDNWHVDYITLVQNSSPDAALDDVAFTALPKPLVYEYTAMPWKQFEFGSELLRDSFTVELYNHNAQSVTVSPIPFIVEELVTGSNVSPSTQPILTGAQTNLAPNVPIIHTNGITGYDAYKAALLQDYAGSDSLIFRVRQIVQTVETGASGLNDGVNGITVFDDYYARDDGSAETNIIAEGRGTEIGVEFTAYTEDSLRAVAISMINVQSYDLTKESFNLKVYVGSLDSEPVVQNILLKPILTSSLFDTIQSFTTYALIDPVTNTKMAIAIPPGEFFIGFQTASDNPIPVGFDRNSLESADNNWMAISTGWFPFPETHQGAVMIRPIFGDGPAVTTSVKPNPVVNLSEVMQVYPNPTDGLLNFISDDLRINEFQYQAYNTLGQVVKQGRLTNRLDFSSLNDGVYYLKLVQDNQNKIYNHKFILSR